MDAEMKVQPEFDGNVERMADEIRELRSRVTELKEEICRRDEMLAKYTADLFPPEKLQPTPNRPPRY